MMVLQSSRETKCPPATPATPKFYFSILESGEPYVLVALVSLMTATIGPAPIPIRIS
jgi:hypothetical protein